MLQIIPPQLGNQLLMNSQIWLFRALPKIHQIRILFGLVELLELFICWQFHHIGTGEWYGSYWQNSQAPKGRGVLKTSDSGVTWEVGLPICWLFVWFLMVLVAVCLGYLSQYSVQGTSKNQQVGCIPHQSKCCLRRCSNSSNCCFIDSINNNFCAATSNGLHYLDANNYWNTLKSTSFFRTCRIDDEWCSSPYFVWLSKFFPLWIIY